MKKVFFGILMLLVCTLIFAEGKILKAKKGEVDSEHPAPDGYYIYYSNMPGVNIDYTNPATYNLKFEVSPDANGDLVKTIVLCNKDAKFVVTAFCEATSGLPEDRLESEPGTLLPDEQGEQEGDIQENEYFGACKPKPPIEIHF